jgi:excisionase family DNA binding protein
MTRANTPEQARQKVRTMQQAPIALKISEACSAARVGRTSLYDAIKRGELRALKRGKSTIILADDLRRWLESLPSVYPQPPRPAQLA